MTAVHKRALRSSRIKQTDWATVTSRVDESRSARPSTALRQSQKNRQVFRVVLNALVCIISVAMAKKAWFVIWSNIWLVENINLQADSRMRQTVVKLNRLVADHAITDHPICGHEPMSVHYPGAEIHQCHQGRINIKMNKHKIAHKGVAAFSCKRVVRITPQQSRLADGGKQNRPKISYVLCDTCSNRRYHTQHARS